MSRFGGIVRERRQQKEITLRKFAEMVGVSPTFISRMERDEIPPPGEDKIKAIARTLEMNADELLAEAGKFSRDLREIIQQKPRQYADFLRSTTDLTPTEFAKLERTLRSLRRHKEN